MNTWSSVGRSMVKRGSRTFRRWGLVGGSRQLVGRRAGRAQAYLTSRQSSPLPGPQKWEEAKPHAPVAISALPHDGLHHLKTRVQINFLPPLNCFLSIFCHKKSNTTVPELSPYGNVSWGLKDHNFQLPYSQGRSTIRLARE